MTTTIAVECDAAISDELAAQLKAVSEGELVTAQKNNLDGTIETVLHILQVATPFIGAVSPILVAYLSRVKKIKVGDVEIENATADDLRTLLTRCDKKT
jgi:hypothetical protein